MQAWSEQDDDQEAVMDKLDEVEDPELELSIVELGLVYDVRFEDKDEGLHAQVDLTLTLAALPLLRSWRQLCAALQTDGLASVHINLVWTPRWSRKSMPAKTLTRMDMGIWD